MKNSKGKRKVVWEHLVNWGPERNRCLQIPTERNARGGISFLIVRPVFSALRYAHSWKLDLGLELALWYQVRVWVDL